MRKEEEEKLTMMNNDSNNDDDAYTIDHDIAKEKNTKQEKIEKEN